ncbi:SprT-like domain-containing protein [Salmonella enterica]|nr:sprT domain-containing protein [Salmonella enterica]EEP3373011.1 sprT domain-containing protein [Salmonella enterica]EFP6579718.1 sprT domain-containing protein [Salmonella enterica]EGC7971001.1 sprT domain-containing protein [Salmonella enterica]EIV4461178.1 SprT-like domain-containing protein [Salmonella enterica]
MNVSLPTTETYAELQLAYEHFNKTLFNSRLPACLITLQREKRTYGYFSSNRFVARGSKVYTDEIALNPSYFGIRTVEETLSTLVHEMVHLDQQHNGKPGRGRYHNRQWADWMIGVGLYPSSTGKEGGAITGDCMSHYIVKNGAYEKACRSLMTKEFTLSWIDRFPPVRQNTMTGLLGGLSSLLSPGGDDEDFDDDADEDNTNGAFIETLVFRPTDEKQTRFKFSCPKCQMNAWGKNSLKILCGECEDHPLMMINNENNRYGND